MKVVTELMAGLCRTLSSIYLRFVILTLNTPPMRYFGCQQLPGLSFQIRLEMLA